MPVTVLPLSPDTYAKWDEFVEAHTLGTPFHLVAWKKTLESVFGYESRCLVALRNETVEGILPLFFVQNFLRGKLLISSPFAVYGGILAKSEEAHAALATGAADLARNLDVEYLEFRNAHPEQRVGWNPVTRYVTFTKPLTPIAGDAFVQSLPKKTRNLVRKALKSQYTSRVTRDWRTFESLYSKNLRRLGTPSFPAKLFPTLLANFGDIVDIREVLLDNKVVAVSFNFLFHGEMHTYYAASDQDALQFAPNMFLYYDHLVWAGQNAIHTFDFGRSKRNTGTCDFKSQWDTVMRELPYEILLVKRKDMPDFSPVNPKFSLPIKIWQKLPLPVTRIVGPHLNRLFP